MFLYSSNFCPLNLLLVRSHQEEIVIVKRFIQERNNVTRVRLEPRSCNQGRRKDGHIADWSLFRIGPFKFSKEIDVKV